jgi:hypothetical protein
VEARVLESHPPRLVVELEADMPTPGFRLIVDSASVSSESGRIVLRITETAPGGIVTQVITPTRVQATLTPVPIGRYSLEVWTRASPRGQYSLAHSFTVAASGGGP